MSKRILDDSTDEEDFVHDVKTSRQEIIDTDRSITCTLPPSCHAKPRKFNVADYEQHYQRHHSNVCYECDASLPSAHFLDLHLTEVHSPIFEARKERGEAVYRCFVESCTDAFTTITRRRRHLEYQHAYPSEYRFNIVQKGINSWAQSLLYPSKKETRPAPRESVVEPKVDHTTEEPKLNRATRRALAREEKDSKMQDIKPVNDDAKAQHARDVENLFKSFDQL